MEPPVRSMFSSADAYDRFIGRYGPSLSRAHIAAAAVPPGASVLDVGSGPGALAVALAEVTDEASVAAVDPSPAFVDACQRRLPNADVRQGSAEDLPDFEQRFDVVMSQLVLNFMDDSEAGVRAMRSACREGGLVTSSVWDYAEGMTLLRAFWDAALEMDPHAPDEGETMRYCSPDELRELWEHAGLGDIRTEELRSHATYASFDELWEPLPTGVGAAGAYCATLDAERQAALRTAFFRRLGEPHGEFTLAARAWFVAGVV